MSVCLAVTKTLAISSLGVYAGILTTSTIIINSNPTHVILSSLDIITQTQLKKLINNIVTSTGIIGTFSSLCFAISYFGLPKIWKHPYLLYGMAIPPIITTYLCLYRANWTKQTILSPQKEETDTQINDSKAILMKDLGDSIVDLNDQKDPINESNLLYIKKICKRIGLHLTISSVISILGLAQSIVGVYGEGQF
ncbi:Autophagy- protein 33 [Maudiozyma exigua]|uniref:Autophagy- protein 33 n=1 Tax=Maudiozyma exigua TaxID=34358 RepID=A0A9P6W5U4_MAUEX|nr:Autophagy- protein 33 [Kazachstania exigua]